MTEPLLCARHDAFYIFTVKCCSQTKRLAGSLRASVMAYDSLSPSQQTVPSTGLGTWQALDKYLVDCGKVTNEKFNENINSST